MYILCTFVARAQTLTHCGVIFGNMQAAPNWQTDREAPNCNKCKTTFSLFLRRHHCRHCGKVWFSYLRYLSDVGPHGETHAHNNPLPPCCILCCFPNVQYFPDTHTQTHIHTHTQYTHKTHTQNTHTLAHIHTHTHHMFEYWWRCMLYKDWKRASERNSERARDAACVIRFYL